MAGGYSEPSSRAEIESSRAEIEDPFMTARHSSFASNMSADGVPHRFAPTSVATGPSFSGSRLGRGVFNPANHGNILAHDSASMVEERLFSAAPESTPLSTAFALERPQTASARFSHTPQDCDIFAATGLRSVATPLPQLPAADCPLFHSKRRDGPFTPRDSLRPNGQFS